MASRKPLAAKPGTQPGVFRPDNILSFTVGAGQPAALLEFLFGIMPQARRTTVKDYLKHRQVRLNGSISTRFDAEIKEGD